MSQTGVRRPQETAFSGSLVQPWQPIDASRPKQSTARNLLGHREVLFGTWDLVAVGAQKNRVKR
jgi:hypothetical protein